MALLFSIDKDEFKIIKMQKWYWYDEKLNRITFKKNKKDKIIIKYKSTYGEVM